MASLDSLAATINDLATGVSTMKIDVEAKLAALQTTIDGLVAGEVSQADIDALAAQAADIDAAVHALDAEVAPPAIPAENPV